MTRVSGEVKKKSKLLLFALSKLLWGQIPLTCWGIQRRNLKWGRSESIARFKSGL